MKPISKHQASTAKRGFTILELTIVLAVIAAIMGGMISLLSAALEGRSYNATVAKLKVLQQALTDYRIAYNTLPCPANSTSVTNNPAVAFGIASTSVNCIAGSPAADIADTTAAVGLVPVHTLGLPDDMALDGWGRRIRYGVSTAFVNRTFDALDTFTGDGSTVAFTLARDPVSKTNISVSVAGNLQPASSYSVSGTTLTLSTAPANGAVINVGDVVTSTVPRITVTNNENGVTLTDTALFVLVSYGKNGHGARAGAVYASTTLGSYINAGITNVNELLNCKCFSATGLGNGAADLDAFVQGEPKPDPDDPLNNFDDVLVFSTRADLRGPTE